MWFRCGLEDHWIADFPKQENPEKRFHLNTEKTRTFVYKSTKKYMAPDKSTERKESQKIYACMARMYYNVENPRRYFWDSSQLTNWLLYSG